MAKRKKYARLPNGYGTIRYLGDGRRNPYAVHPPAEIESGTGNVIRQKPLCYVDSWIKGFAVLTAYKAGTYTPGMENALKIENTGSPDDVAQRVLADYNRVKGIVEPKKGKTFAEVYEDFYKWKYESGKEYSESSKKVTRTAFANCTALHGKEFSTLRYTDLQAVVDNCQLKHASLELIVSLFKQMYNYADIVDLVEKNHAAHVRINTADDDEHGVPFNGDELHTLWESQSDPVPEFLLIMCYSGFRISEYKGLEVNTQEGYFKGGLKTAAGKNRIVPIHSAIFPLVEKRLSRDGSILASPVSSFRRAMYSYCDNHGFQRHTPHDCRHTFSALCEKYGVSENDRKRMLGHSFGGDITNQVYGHRSLADLKAEIEKIKV